MKFLVMDAKQEKKDKAKAAAKGKKLEDATKEAEDKEGEEKTEGADETEGAEKTLGEAAVLAVSTLKNVAFSIEKG